MTKNTHHGLINIISANINDTSDEQLAKELAAAAEFLRAEEEAWQRHCRPIRGGSAAGYIADLDGLGNS